MTHTSAATLRTPSDTLALGFLSLYVIIFQALLYGIPRLLAEPPPTSMALPLLSVGVAAGVVLGVALVPRLRRYSPWLQIFNAVVALSVVQVLALRSGSSPFYLALSLAAVYGTPLTFARLNTWLWALGLVCVASFGVAVMQDAFTQPEAAVVPLFFGANSLLATALIFGRERLLTRGRRTGDAMVSMPVPERLSDERTSDLVLAREIQTSLLPAPMPTWPAFELVCYSQPARDVGGDFYSYYAWSERHVALAVGDVSGKGVAAALLMAASLSLVNTAYTRRVQPQRRVARLDRQVMAYTQPREQNCALCYLELEGTLLTVVNAGGVAPYIRRANGTVEETQAWGFALGHGLGSQVGYQAVQRSMARGDMVVIVSDGVLEARNARGALWSFDRLEQAIASGPGTSAAAMRTHLLKRLAKYTGRVELQDDITIVVLRVR